MATQRWRAASSRFRVRPVAFLALAACTAVAPVAEAANRKMTVTNTCPYTLWMAYFTSVGPQPSQKTGWESPSGTTLTFEVEESWGGRIWARTNCDFTSDKPDYLQCETGGCKGGLECDKSSGTGVLPVTLAEFNLQTGVDHYDTSNVDGFNVPLAVTTNKDDCPLSNCPFDLNKNCPDDLQFKNEKGEVVGCLTDCGATENPMYCCAGEYSTPDVCPSSNIPNYKWWKDNCPIAYAYAYDESSGTALFVCNSNPDYIITFCPSDDLYDDTAVLPDGSTISQGTGDPPKTVAVTATLGAEGGSGGGAASPTKTNEAGASSSGEVGATAGSGTGAGTGASATSGGSAGAGTGSGSPTSSAGGATASPSSGGSGSSSSDTSADGTILGMSKNVAIGIAVVLVVLILAGIAYALFAGGSGHKKKSHSHKHGHSDDESDVSDTGTGTGSDSTGSDDDDDNDEKSRHRRR